jgi:hypothetical protein
MIRGRRNGALLALVLVAFFLGNAEADADCLPGTVASKFTEGACYPPGADDCGRLGQSGFCPPGTKCSDEAICISATDALLTTSCAKFGRPLERCPTVGWLCHPKSGCHPLRTIACEEGGYCEQGFRCGKKGECLRVGAVSCAYVNRPEESCPVGSACHPKASGCYPVGAIPCPGGGYCNSGFACTQKGDCVPIGGR